MCIRDRTSVVFHFQICIKIFTIAKIFENYSWIYGSHSANDVTILFKMQVFYFIMATWRIEYTHTHEAIFDFTLENHWLDLNVKSFFLSPSSPFELWIGYRLSQMCSNGGQLCFNCVFDYAIFSIILASFPDITGAEEMPVLLSFQNPEPKWCQIIILQFYSIVLWLLSIIVISKFFDFQKIELKFFF